MSQPGRRWRILTALAVLGGVVLTASPAWAHVEIDPGSEPKGSTVVLISGQLVIVRNAATCNAIALQLRAVASTPGTSSGRPASR
jgi:hypothetical protein